MSLLLQKKVVVFLFGASVVVFGEEVKLAVPEKNDAAKQYAKAHQAVAIFSREGENKCAYLKIKDSIRTLQKAIDSNTISDEDIAFIVKQGLKNGPPCHEEMSVEELADIRRDYTALISSLPVLSKEERELIPDDLLSVFNRLSKIPESNHLQASKCLLSVKNSDALSVALNVVCRYNSHALDIACLHIMRVQNKETFSYYQHKKESLQGFDRSDKKALVLWGQPSEDVDVFRFVIDSLIKDKTNFNDSKMAVAGRQLRFCDYAYNIAFKNIYGDYSWSKSGAFQQLARAGIPPRNRGADLVLFKKWWAENKANLKWSEEKKKFYVDQTLEKGTGILNVKRHRNREQPTVKPRKE
jgi:hypothetical protein